MSKSVEATNGLRFVRREVASIQDEKIHTQTKLILQQAHMVKVRDDVSGVLIKAYTDWLDVPVSDER